jgi:TRAP-type C4-dicarboxylate transport system permease small subunit
MLVKIRTAFERLLEVIVLLLMALLALVVVSGVLFRKFGAPLVWYDEVASILLAWLTYYGACLAALRRAHIAYPGFLQSIRPHRRWPLILVREVVVIGFFAVAAWAGWKVVMVLDGYYLTSLPWFPRQITESVVPITAVLFIAAELLSVPDMIREGRPIAEGERLQ